MQPDYAPELTILGVAIGGAIPNINNTISAINKAHYTGFGPAGLLSLHSAYESDAFTQLIHAETFPENRTEFMSLLYLCTSDVLSNFEKKDIPKYLRDSSASL